MYLTACSPAQTAEKFQTGFELEANVIKVPESMFPRNLNARMQLHTLGQRINGLEVHLEQYYMTFLMSNISTAY